MSARRAIVSLVFGALAACSLEDENPTERCNADLTCSGELVCYRGFCVESEEVVASTEDAGDVERPSLVDPPTDAGAARPRDASSTPSTRDAAQTASVESPVTSNDSVPMDESGQPPAPGPVDAAVSVTTQPPAPAPQPPPAAQPAPQPAPQPQPAELVPEAGIPSAVLPSTWLTDLVELGLLPVYVLDCAQKCLTIQPGRDCEECLEKALQGEGKKVECENGRGRGNRASCVVRNCADDECEK